jgi:16S rRNA (uracil1498-N3)-methyltransferase
VLTIDGEEAHHAVRVVRCRVEDEIRVCNGLGQVLECKVAEILKQTVSKKHSDQSPWKLSLRVVQVKQEKPRDTPVHVFACVPKAERLSDMVDGLSQVGADALTLITTQRSVTEGRPIYLDRLRRIAIESLKQCGRAWLMQVQGPVTLKEALANARRPESGFRYILAADGQGLFPQEVFSREAVSSTPEPTPIKKAGGIAIFVGPEGGLTPEELDLIAPLATNENASGHGQKTAGTQRAMRLKLGPHILRIETAAVVGAAMVINSAAP